MYKNKPVEQIFTNILKIYLPVYQNIQRSLDENNFTELYGYITNKKLKCYHDSPIGNENTAQFQRIISKLLTVASNNSNNKIDILEYQNHKNLLENVDFLKISLNEIDILNYENIGKSLKDYGGFNEHYSDSFPTQEKFLRIIDNTFYSEETEHYKAALKSLSYGEMKSIYVYTSACFTKINALLRDNTHYSLNQENSIILVNIAVAAHTLNKITKEINKNKLLSSPIVIREEKDFNLELYKTNLDSDDTIKNVTFTSTILKYEVSNEFNKKDQGVKILFKNTQVGAYISPLSQRPYEHEFLFPPGIEYKITGYIYSFHGCIFTAEILNIHSDSSVELMGQQDCNYSL